MDSVCEAAGGAAGLLSLARAWHERVMADEIVSHAFESGFRVDHCERLAAYWAQALGDGDGDAYTDRFGDEAFVVREHSGNGPHAEMNAHAIACFDAALADVGYDERLRGVLHDYFAWATPFVNRFERSRDDVPADLELPRWSWDGLVNPDAL